MNSIHEKKSNHKKVLVAGDIVLDIYCVGSVERISREAPIPILRRRDTHVKYIPGGAANAAVNLAAAGAEVDLLAAVGRDEDGENLLQCLRANNIGVQYVSRIQRIVTTSKLRYIGQNNQQLFRVDTELNDSASVEDIAENLAELEKNITDYSLFLLSDYMEGFLSREMIQHLIALARQNQIPVLIDVKGIDVDKYCGATLLKPNREDLGQLTRMPVMTQEQVIEASVRLCNNLRSQFVLTTLGADGMVLTDAHGFIKKVSSAAKEVFDVTGAGDTVIAYLAAELARGKNIADAMETANYAAGVQVSKMGTSIVYPDEVDRAIKAENSYFEYKKLNMYRKNGLNEIYEAKRQGKKIVFTNGCFDILHAGHVTYLQYAREMGDILVVGVNSDASIKRIKGEGRPVNSLSDRLMLLAALRSVDYVIPFEEDTPQALIEMVDPDVLVKGGDYTLDAIVGGDYVRSRGGIVTTVPFVEGKSTTSIISKIRE